MHASYKMKFQTSQNDKTGLERSLRWEKEIISRILQKIEFFMPFQGVLWFYFKQDAIRIE